MTLAPIPTPSSGRTIGSLLPTSVTDLLDEPTATRLFVRAGLTITGARPDYLRHKPGETSIVGYRFDIPDSDTEGLGYAQWCVRVERAEEIHRKALTLRPRMSAVGVSTIRVDDHTVFYGFPNDARLRRLRWYTTGRKLKRALAALTPTRELISKTDSTSTILRYKPERRLVARVDLVTTDGSRQTLLVRYTTARHASRLAATAAALLDNGVQTPEPLAQLDEGRVGVDEFIDGVELQTWLLSRESVADHLAESLLAFHRTCPPDHTPHRREQDLLANANDGLSALSRWNRGLMSPVRSVAKRLDAARPSTHPTPVLIHGDLHDKNVLVNDRGIWFIDLERAAVGSAASDLGRLRGHAISLGIRQPGWSAAARTHAERVIDQYRSKGRHGVDSTVDDRTLGWHCAIALVDQALLVTRHVESGWETSAHALLEAAASELSPSRSRRPDPESRTGVNSP